MKSRILVLFTCFNRKEKTVHCVNSLMQDEKIQFDFIVVDDNSTDGTVDRLKERGNIEVYTSQGGLYYSGGMRVAIELAKKRNLKNYDYVMLINDDVAFFENSISKMIDFLDGKKEIVVGAMCDTAGNLSYGGVVKTHWFKPSYKNVMSTKKNRVYCDTFCANCVLIPSSIFGVSENIDPVYRHAMGDFDYGFSIRNMGYRIVASDFFVGQCNDNDIAGSWKDTKLSRKQRNQLKQSPKGLPGKEWFHYLKKNHGLFTAIVYSIIPYVKIMLNK